MSEASNLFGNVALVIGIEIAIIIFCFFLPEMLYRITKKQQGWHVILASFILIFSVASITIAHGVFSKSDSNSLLAPSRDTVATLPEPEDTEYTIRANTAAHKVNTESDFGLTVYNFGPPASFTCLVHLLDEATGLPLDKASYTLTDTNNTLFLDNNDQGDCDWKVSFSKPGTYILDTHVQGDSIDPTNHQQITLKITPEPVEPISDAVWIYHGGNTENANAAAKQLATHGYTNVALKGNWGKELSTQYIFYRSQKRTGLKTLQSSLQEELSNTDKKVEVHYYKGENIGKKIKKLFTAHPEMDFLVIIQ